jgi:hypothetical protein
VTGTHDTPGAVVVVHTWVEPHDPVLRGRLVEPVAFGRPAARGVDELTALVRDALVHLEEELGRDVTATDE